jgi:Tfp pilus assembly protein PilF
MIQKRPTPSALRIVLAGALVGLVLPTLGACGSKQSEAPPPDTAQNPKHDQTSGDRIKRAEQFIQAKAFDAARNELNQAVAEDPHNAKALFYLGVASEALGDAEGAKSNYRKALGENPKLVDAAQNLSALLLDGGDPKSALTVAEAGLAA